MRPSGLQDGRELVALPLERLAEAGRCLRKRIRHREQREASRGREHVVGGLAHVDVIVRVHERVLAAAATEDLRRTIGEHLVGVHVVRRAGAGLVHVHDELIAHPAGEHLVGRAPDRVGNAAIEPAERGIRCSRGFLDPDRRDDELRRRRQSADGKVLDRAPGLRAVIGSCRHFDVAERVVFDAVFHDPRLVLRRERCRAACWSSSGRA